MNSEAAREHLRSALDLIDEGLAMLRKTQSDNVGNAFRVEIAERLERQQRTIRGLSYRMFGELHDPPDGPDPTMVDDVSLREVLWARLRITPGEIRHRARLAARIAPRRSLQRLGGFVRHSVSGRQRFSHEDQLATNDDPDK